MSSLGTLSLDEGSDGEECEEFLNAEALLVENAFVFSHPGKFSTSEGINHAGQFHMPSVCEALFSHPARPSASERNNAVSCLGLSMNCAAQGAALCEACDLFAHPGKVLASQHKSDYACRVSNNFTIPFESCKAVKPECDIDMKSKLFGQYGSESGSESESAFYDAVEDGFVCKVVPRVW